MTGPMDITVMDPAGRVVLRERVNSANGCTDVLDLENQSTGMYLVTLRGRDATATTRLIIQ